MTNFCDQCPRKCKINRDVSVGFCGANNNIKIAKVMLHYFEEPVISGTEKTKKKGSGAIFFSHCNMKCVYCQNYEISQGNIGKFYSPKDLVEIFKKLEDDGACNINLVTPTHYSKQILTALKMYKPKIPIVWNTSGYEDLQILEQLKDYVDIYLCDIKYFRSEVSKKYSNCENYFEVASKAVLKMREQQPNDIIKNGLMRKGLIVRNLVLPNFAKESISVLNFIKESLGTKTYVSLMSQYVPCGRAINDKLLGRKITKLEYKVVEKQLQTLGFENGWTQDYDSAETCFIPDFKQD